MVEVRVLRKSVVDAPLEREFYIKYLQEVLLLPVGKALLLERLNLKDATRVRVAAWKNYRFHTKLEPDVAEGKFKLTLWRRESKPAETNPNYDYRAFRYEEKKG